jgi:methionyl aminopeptidase
MSIESGEDFAGVAAAGRVAARTLALMLEAVRPGVTPFELNRLGAEEIRRSGARSAPMISVDFPAETCISVNAAVAHGIPTRQPLGPRDLVNIDVSVELDGYFADTGASVPVDREHEALARLCATGRSALGRALGRVRSGGRLSDLGRAAERVAVDAGYDVLRDLCGHGLGRALHEEPGSILGYYDPRDRRRMSDGLVLAIEPFVSTGARGVRTAEDGWTLLTEDGGLAVQFEHTVVVTERGALVMTAERPFLAGSGPAFPELAA